MDICYSKLRYYADFWYVFQIVFEVDNIRKFCLKSFIINVSATFNTELLNNGFELFLPLLPNKPILNLLEYNSVFRTLYHSHLQSSENRACLI